MPRRATSASSYLHLAADPWRSRPSMVTNHAAALASLEIGTH